MSYHSAKRRRSMGDVDTIQNLIQSVVCDPNSPTYDPNNSVCPTITTIYGPGAGTVTGGDQATGKCLVAALAATAVLDGYTSDLAVNWNPTGAYTPKQITDAVGQVMTVLNSSLQGAQAALAATGSATSGDDITNIKLAIDDINDAIAKSKPFTDGAAAGIQQIEAPGFKRWCTNSLNAASNASNSVYVVACLTPWWVTAWNAIARAFQAAWDFLKKLVGIVIDAAKEVLKIADLMTTLIAVAPFAVAAAAAYYFFVYKKRR